MPRYDYCCSECRTTFEVIHPYGAPAQEVTCPSGHRSVQRRFSPPEILFRGSGWYSTDHPRSGGERGGEA